MRVPLLSDVHRNSTALDAELTDVDRAGGVDEYRALGDIVLGPDPVGVVERLDAVIIAVGELKHPGRYVVKHQLGEMY